MATTTNGSDAPAIAVRGLSKTFDEVEAVRGVDFEVAVGEVFGFLGPNGAGKTTTINMLCTLVKPTAGSATVAGHDVVRERDDVRRHIGLVFQDPTLDGYLTAAQNLQLHAELYGVQSSLVRPRMQQVMEMVGLWERRTGLVQTFSGGMKRRLEIARGLLHSPRVLFLDEPTIGLDVTSQKKVRAFLKQYNREHRIVTMLTSHYMQDIEELCERVIIIDHGRIFFDGPLSAIIDRFATHKVLGLSFAARVECDFAAFGEVVERTDLSVQLKVPRGKVAEVCREA
ncbi:MAG: ATP-binding cassette domain-containing protein, partial [Solirubrobacterales bacterium]|nr:ATP-binding cassette domain-containing protein [Solirubrobacterales bacterium]